MAEDPTDSEAIRASFERPDAFEPIFDRHYGAIFRYLARRVGQDSGAELASEVFTIAFARRGTFHTDSPSARPWLYGIAANLARRQARTWKRRRRAGKRFNHTDAIWFDPAAEDRMDAENLRSALADAVSKLRSTDREVLLMHALTDLTYREVSEALAIPIGTVRSRMSRARRQVKETLLAGGQVALAAELTEAGDADAS
ncbi:MAG: sigma-70 family RNA polymerase sigma factor [bacterium]|nr:sigma-70 family RNA polymerase sigma factor [bacterium]